MTSISYCLFLIPCTSQALLLGYCLCYLLGGGFPLCFLKCRCSLALLCHSEIHFLPPSNLVYSPAIYVVFSVLDASVGQKPRSLKFIRYERVLDVSVLSKIWPSSSRGSGITLSQISHCLMGCIYGQCSIAYKHTVWFGSCLTSFSSSQEKEKQRRFPCEMQSTCSNFRKHIFFYICA